MAGLSMNECCAPTKDSPPAESYVSRIDINDTKSGSGKVIVETFPVTFKGYTYKGTLAYPESAQQSPVPLVLVYPNYAGRKQFDDDQACFIAKLGYAGLAVDMYKETEQYPFSMRNPSDYSKVVEHLNAAFEAYNGILKDPHHWRALQSLYLKKAREHRAVHKKYAAGIGYCFGGQCLLEMLRNGDDIQGLVSFHGVLQSHPVKEPFDFTQPGLTRVPLPKSKCAPNAYNKSCKVLIMNGELDLEAQPDDIQEFQEEMKSNGVQDWTIVNMSDTDHGFALPPGVFINKYNEQADRRSSIAMIHLFNELWGQEFAPKWDVNDRDFCNAAGTRLFDVPPSKL